MTTPDTEWEKEFDAFFNVHMFGEKEGSWNAPDLFTMKRFISSTISSRDTYWKERVEAVRRDLKARMAHEDYTECVTCDETLHHVDTLLDNLK